MCPALYYAKYRPSSLPDVPIAGAGLREGFSTLGADVLLPGGDVDAVSYGHVLVQAADAEGN